VDVVETSWGEGGGDYADVVGRPRSLASMSVLSFLRQFSLSMVGLAARNSSATAAVQSDAFFFIVDNWRTLRASARDTATAMKKATDDAGDTVAYVLLGLMTANVLALLFMFSALAGYFGRRLTRSRSAILFLFYKIPYREVHKVTMKIKEALASNDNEDSDEEDAVEEAAKGGGEMEKLHAPPVQQQKVVEFASAANDSESNEKKGEESSKGNAWGLLRRAAVMKKRTSRVSVMSAASADKASEKANSTGGGGVGDDQSNGAAGTKYATAPDSKGAPKKKGPEKSGGHGKRRKKEKSKCAKLMDGMALNKETAAYMVPIFLWLILVGILVEGFVQMKGLGMQIAAEIARSGQDITSLTTLSTQAAIFFYFPKSRMETDFQSFPFGDGAPWVYNSTLGGHMLELNDTARSEFFSFNQAELVSSRRQVLQVSAKSVEGRLQYGNLSSDILAALPLYYTQAKVDLMTKDEGCYLEYSDPPQSIIGCSAASDSRTYLVTIGLAPITTYFMQELFQITISSDPTQEFDRSTQRLLFSGILPHVLGGFRQDLTRATSDASMFMSQMQVRNILIFFALEVNLLLFYIFAILPMTRKLRREFSRSSKVLASLPPNIKLNKIIAAAVAESETPRGNRNRHRHKHGHRHGHVRKGKVADISGNGV